MTRSLARRNRRSISSQHPKVNVSPCRGSGRTTHRTAKEIATPKKRTLTLYKILSSTVLSSRRDQESRGSTHWPTVCRSAHMLQIPLISSATPRFKSLITTRQLLHLVRIVQLKNSVRLIHKIISLTVQMSRPCSPKLVRLDHVIPKTLQSVLMATRLQQGHGSVVQKDGLLGARHGHHRIPKEHLGRDCEVFLSARFLSDFGK